MVMDRHCNSMSQNYTFYNGDIELPRVNKFSSPTTSPTNDNNITGKYTSPRSADVTTNVSGDEQLPKVDDTQPLFVPRPPSLPKSKTRVVKAQIHNQLKTNDKVSPCLPPLVHSSRLPPIEGSANVNKLELSVLDNTKEKTVFVDKKEPNKKETSTRNLDSPRHENSNLDDIKKDDGLVNDHNLINKYKEFINKRYTEEIFQENLNNSSSDDDDLSISVSSLSGNEDEGEKTLTTTGFEPLYSLPIKEKKPTPKNVFNKIVISNLSTQNPTNPYHVTGRSLPDLRSVDNFNLKRVSHVTKNESEAESEPGAQIGYKFKPLPPIPGTTSNISCNSGLYETIDGLSKLKNSKTIDADDKEKPKRKSFKNIATILTLVPRLTTNSVRSRKNDHHLADIAQYLPDKKLKIFVGTWNMKGTKFLPSSLDDFLLPPESIYLQDVYVIGTQEGTPFRREWQVRLQETFGPSHVLMQASNFGVLQLSVFVRRELVWFCSSVEQDTIATRMGHTIKTKGALAMSFSVFGTSLLFITSHFTSDKEKLEQRINDYRTICQSIQLPYGDAKEIEKDVTDRFDRVFWFGDFNFRIQKPRSYVDGMLKKYSTKEDVLIHELMKHDQLNELFVKGKIFHGFSESDIHFMPTYKLDVNTSVYDTSSKQRVPSWTDRIVHKCVPSSSLNCLYYNSCNTIKVSDHRPVYGIYEVGVEPYKNNFTLTGANFDREVYVEANLRRNAPNGTQNNSHVCTIL